MRDSIEDEGEQITIDPRQTGDMALDHDGSTATAMLVRGRAWNQTQLDGRSRDTPAPESPFGGHSPTLDEAEADQVDQRSGGFTTADSPPAMSGANEGGMQLVQVAGKTRLS